LADSEAWDSGVGGVGAGCRFVYRYVAICGTTPSVFMASIKVLVLFLIGCCWDPWADALSETGACMRFLLFLFRRRRDIDRH
jgi:hypothetical protein